MSQAPINDKYEGWIVPCAECCGNGEQLFHTDEFLGGRHECDDCSGAGYASARLNDFDGLDVRLADGFVGTVDMTGKTTSVIDANDNERELSDVDDISAVLELAA